MIALLKTARVLLIVMTAVGLYRLGSVMFYTPEPIRVTTLGRPAVEELAKPEDAPLSPSRSVGTTPDAPPSEEAFGLSVSGVVVDPKNSANSSAVVTVGKNNQPLWVAVNDTITGIGAVTAITTDGVVIETTISRKTVRLPGVGNESHLRSTPMVQADPSPTESHTYRRPQQGVAITHTRDTN